MITPRFVVLCESISMVPSVGLDHDSLDSGCDEFPDAMASTAACILALCLLSMPMVRGFCK